MKRIFKTTLAIGMAFALMVGASLTTLAATPKYETSVAATTNAKAKLSKKTLTIYVGQSQTVKLKGAKIKSVTSSKKSVATVTKSGKITAKKAGKATITYKDTKGKKYTCKVTVKNPYIAAKKVTLYAGQSKTVKLVGATIKKYSSSKKSVATVTKSGKITAKAAGSATITYTSTKGKKYTCKVTVKAPYITAKSLVFEIGQYKTVKLVGATLKTYTSSNTAVATVDKTGKITAKGAGTATITFTDTLKRPYICKVTVKAPVMALEKTAISLMEGASEKVVLIGGAIKSAVSADSTIATVDNEGNITAVKEGVVEITYTDEYDREYVCTVTVTALVLPETTIEKTTLTMNAGTETTVLLVNGTIKTAVSDDTEVVTVDTTGKITAIKHGRAIITYTDTYDRTYNCVVTVEPGDDNIGGGPIY